MIRVQKLNGASILLNADWIQSVESTPDTLITLTTGYKLLVKDSLEEIDKRYREYKRSSSSMAVNKETTEQ